jgi:hypothetical protein
VYTLPQILGQVGAIMRKPYVLRSMAECA